MELGKGRLLRTGRNALYQAVHPVHGLAWTDGSQVVLTDVQLHNGEARFGDSKVLGQFEHVSGLSWAPPGTGDTPTLLAVQHKSHVTVWQLCPSTTETSKWLMAQTCEIRESLPVLPQGCVWHPKSAVLTVLTAQDVSVFPNVHCDSSQVKADVNPQGHIHCACWTQDGQRLVVAVGSSLHSYIWNSAHKTLHRCSFCPVFDADSYVRSIEATVDSQVAIATELPLDRICGLNASGAFDVPTGVKDTSPHTLPLTGEVPFMVKGANASETNSEVSVSPSVSSSSDPLDLTHIRFSRSGSKRNSLICLRRKDYLTGTGQDSSHLVLVTFEKEVTMTRKVTIPGILVPDLIAFNLKAQVVAVASSTCNIILIYSVIRSSMPNIQQIRLQSSDRPKGMYFLTDKLLLILVGTQKSTDLAFLPSSKSEQYIIRLVVKEVKLEEESSVTSNKSQSRYSLLNKANRRKQIQSLSPDFSHLARGLLLPSSPSNQNGSPGKTLIKEIKSPTAGICEESTAVETLDAEPINRSVTKPQPRSPPESSPVQCNPPPELPNLPQRKNLQREKEACQISKKLEVLSRTLTEMQQCLSELTNCLHNGKKSSPGYQLSQDPPYVHIIYQKPYYVAPVIEKRAVLLCDGKLRLSTVQQAFGLSLIEMLHGSLWILLTADSEGFIPLTFTSTQELIIRDGNLSRSDVFEDSFSQNLDPGPALEYFRDHTARSLETTNCSNHLGNTA
ncbi:PREDICTED: WD repeat-containing protein C2orf44 homolog [Elephantulus edwardii]|uniref:WD repeat-containing protein C2orf44 homolog n=1 Tax=Elephantulus edwardii TaxID=28737 RepID=UPI0003F0EC7D|nr:PREDICTED: WD repeat-containing protein C2orf44 homolog [Elephantulus edwardii]